MTSQSSQYRAIEDGLRDMYNRLDVCLNCGEYEPPGYHNLSPVLEPDRNWRREVPDLLRTNGVDIGQLIKVIEQRYPASLTQVDDEFRIVTADGCFEIGRLLEAVGIKNNVQRSAHPKAQTQSV